MKKMFLIPALIFLLVFTTLLPAFATQTTAPPQPKAIKHSGPPTATNYIAPGDWPQLGHNPQRTNYTPLQVDPPYCYTWKWYEAPLASRAQPVVADGRLFIGDLYGTFHARNADTGASLWTFPADGIIRHSAGVLSDKVIFSTHAGTTYALNTATGATEWETVTGSSASAPLIDPASNKVYVASANGNLSALNGSTGTILWQYHTDAPILISPALSLDGETVYLGDESVTAIAVNANTGQELWRNTLQGQSMSARYPVVLTGTVIYRTQPLYFFHHLLQDADDIMDQAGNIDPNWAADWAKVKPEILNYLNGTPSLQSFFVLNSADGGSRGTAPMLYTYGNNDIANTPIIRGTDAYVTYRARHGIQTDAPTVHVTTRYDAELGLMNLASLDITGLTASEPLSGQPQFRMTSDEPAMLTMGGNILWVDNWERAGGIDVSNGDLIHIGAVSNKWPECPVEPPVECGPGTDNPFFPLSGNPNDPAYPFPSPRVTEGIERGGIVIANDMLYWRVIGAGLAGISHQSGGSCPTPQVWTGSGKDVSPSSTLPMGKNVWLSSPPSGGIEGGKFSRPLADYVTLDLTTPITNPSPDLVARLQDEVQAIVDADDHLMPFFLERGFSQIAVWPHNTTNPPGLPQIEYRSHGNLYWHDPGELLYTMALAYPYLDSQLQNNVNTYMAEEMGHYPPLQALPFGGLPWLKTGVPREDYAIPFRDSLNSWPPPDTHISTLYALWLWSKNTGDWTYAQNNWTAAQNLFNNRKNNMPYYADIAGAIGYARMADHFGNTSAFDEAEQVAVAAMTAGLDLNARVTYANNQYLDPRDRITGWSLPALFGMTPEVGLYLQEQFNGDAQTYINLTESGDGLRWWYLTRAGVHAEVGETSFLAPNLAWSHFLAHAYIIGDDQETLRPWLDRPWAKGDLFSIQKLVATIHADGDGTVILQPNLNSSSKTVSNQAPETGQGVTYTVVIRNTGGPLTETVTLTDTLPAGLSYVGGSLQTSSGTVDDSSTPTLYWSGSMQNISEVTISYEATVNVGGGTLQQLTNNAIIDAGSAGILNRSVMIIVNAERVYLPLIVK